MRPGDDLVARELDGLRWYRCLRCDSWLPRDLPAAPTRPFPPGRDEITLPLRGRPLRDKYVLRLIAIDRAVHFVVLGVLAIAVFVFIAHKSTWQQDFLRIVAALQGSVGGPVNTSSGGIEGELTKLFAFSTRNLEMTGVALAAYAALEGVEAVGLWHARRWAEYLTFIATTLLLVPRGLRDRRQAHRAQVPHAGHQRGHRDLPGAGQATVRAARRRAGRARPAGGGGWLGRAGTCHAAAGAPRRPRHRPQDRLRREAPRPVLDK